MGKASLAMPTWRAGGLLPGRPLKPGWEAAALWFLRFGWARHRLRCRHGGRAGFCPAARLNPGGKRLRFGFFDSDGQGIACDADMEGGRALPAARLNPGGKRLRFGFFELDGQGIACDADMEGGRAFARPPA